ncbi:MAG: thiol reductant ABC exporter subunit CydC [Sporolactobacillus sp.]
MKTWMIPYFKTHWRGLCLAISLAMLAALCATGLLFTSGYLISKAALQPENILMIYVPIVGVRTFGIFRAVFQYGGRMVGHNTILRILSEMRTRLYKRLEPAALFFRARHQTGDVLGVLSEDIEHLQDIYLRTAIPAATAVLIYAGWVAALGFLDGNFALLMAIYLFILLAIFPALSLLLSSHRRKRLSEHRHGLYEELTDAVLGVSDWMLSGRQAILLKRHEMLQYQVARDERWLNRFRNLREFISQLLIGGAVIAVLLWSSTMVSDHQMSRTLIAAFVLIVFTIGESLLPLSESVERVTQYQEAFKRLNGLSDANEEDHDQVKANDREVGQSMTIQADHLSYRYDGQQSRAVNEVSLQIRQGECVALIGRSGAGKSTLIHLIYGALEPSEGTVRLNGTDCSAIGRQMSQYISVLNQEPHLFDTTVYNNLALGNEQAGKERIIQAAKWVGLHDKIEQLPNRYATRMHEAGAIFSGGEQERLALARILLQDNPIVILDEPTVGLDPLTERELLQTIFSTLKGKTLIWITHHLTGTEKMDQIIFMENGSIEMQGNHHQLLQTNERYRRLYQLDVPMHLRRQLNPDENGDA